MPTLTQPKKEQSQVLPFLGEVLSEILMVKESKKQNFRENYIFLKKLVTYVCLTGRQADAQIKINSQDVCCQGSNNVLIFAGLERRFQFCRIFGQQQCRPISCQKSAIRYSKHCKLWWKFYIPSTYQQFHVTFKKRLISDIFWRTRLPIENQPDF